MKIKYPTIEEVFAFESNGRLQQDDATFKAALQQFDVHGIRLLAWGETSTENVIAVFHPAIGRCTHPFLRELAQRLAVQLKRPIYWAKDEETKWEFLSLHEPRRRTDFIAMCNAAGEYQLLGVS